MTPRKRNASASPGYLAEEAAEEGEGVGESEAATTTTTPPAGPPAKKKRAPRKPKEPIVYVIPDIETKTTTYK